jgi:hypothetical protein
MIVIALSERRMRFGGLRTRVAGISGKVLTDTLRFDRVQQARDAFDARLID